MTEPAAWFVPALPEQKAPVQVFAFPQAGAGCASFTACAAAIPGRLDFWTVNLPGRQARFLEEPRTAIGPLVQDLADALPGYQDGRPYALVGYCAGAMIAFALAAELGRRGLEPPANLVVVSFAAPHHGAVHPSLLALPSDGFWAEIVALGGVHADLARDADAVEIFEPGLRGDFSLLADLQADGPPAPVDVPITAVFGLRDDLLDPAAVEDWKDYTTGGFTTRLVDGDHWLLENHAELLGSALATEMTGS